MVSKENNFEVVVCHTLFLSACVWLLLCDFPAAAHVRRQVLDADGAAGKQL